MNLRKSMPRNDPLRDPIRMRSSTEHPSATGSRQSEGICPSDNEVMLCPCPLSASVAFACCRGDGTKFIYLDLKTIPNPM